MRGRRAGGMGNDPKAAAKRGIRSEGDGRGEGSSAHARTIGGAVPSQ